MFTLHKNPCLSLEELIEYFIMSSAKSVPVVKPIDGVCKHNVFELYFSESYHFWLFPTTINLLWTNSLTGMSFIIAVENFQDGRNIDANEFQMASP